MIMEVHRLVSPLNTDTVMREKKWGNSVAKPLGTRLLNTNSQATEATNNFKVVWNSFVIPAIFLLKDPSIQEPKNGTMSLDWEAFARMPPLPVFHDGKQNEKLHTVWEKALSDVVKEVASIPVRARAHALLPPISRAPAPPRCQLRSVQTKMRRHFSNAKMAESSRVVAVSPPSPQHWPSTLASGLALAQR